MLNPAVTREIGRNVPLAPGPIKIKNFGLNQMTELQRRRSLGYVRTRKSSNHYHKRPINQCCKCSNCSCFCHEKPKIPQMATSETKPTLDGMQNSIENRSIQIEHHQEHAVTDQIDMKKHTDGESLDHQNTLAT